MNVKGQMLVMRNIIEIILVIGMAFFFISCLSKTVDLFAGNSGTLPERTYLSFVEQVKDLPFSNKIPYSERSELFLEDGQAVVYFEQNKDKMSLFVDASLDTGDKNYDVIITKPSSCTSSGCVCFLKEKEITTEMDVLGIVTEWHATITPKDATCIPDLKLSLDTCTIGIKNDVVSYTCSDGFLIERHLIKEVEDDFLSFKGNDIYMTTPKNLVLTLTNEADKVSISPRIAKP
ncbi:MAG TPA: hypothetical protein VJI15_04265 [Candidatus Nanoarchaeia archaeon]|nr:hypothetical protein [Candidatus Nanoarchaeia archaeon]